MLHCELISEVFRFPWVGHFCLSLNLKMSLVKLLHEVREILLLILMGKRDTMAVNRIPPLSHVRPGDRECRKTRQEMTGEPLLFRYCNAIGKWRWSRSRISAWIFYQAIKSKPCEIKIYLQKVYRPSWCRDFVESAKGEDFLGKFLFKDRKSLGILASQIPELLSFAV